MTRNLLADLQAEEHQEMAALEGLERHQLTAITRGLEQVGHIARRRGGVGRYEDLLEAAHIALLTLS